MKTLEKVVTFKTADREIAGTGRQCNVSAFGNVYRFTGRRFDDKTGLYYYRHRFYEPRGGRFLSRDPKGYRDGLNAYAYVKNSAVNLIDPLGLDFQYLGWKWGTPKGGVKAQVFPYYQVRLECECINGYWYIRFRGADVRVRIIINERPGDLRLRKEYEAMRNADPSDDPRDGSGSVVSPTALSYQNAAGETIPTAFGVYGHELRHVESIREAYNRAMADGSKLRNEIARMEKKTHGKREKDCRSQIAEKGYWRERLLQLLKEVVEEGAGHDTDDATTKPDDGRTYEPPGGVMPNPQTRWEKLTSQGYTQYKELND